MVIFILDAVGTMVLYLMSPATTSSSQRPKVICLRCVCANKLCTMKENGETRPAAAKKSASPKSNNVLSLVLPAVLIGLALLQLVQYDSQLNELQAFNVTSPLLDRREWKIKAETPAPVEPDVEPLHDSHANHEQTITEARDDSIHPLVHLLVETKTIDKDKAKEVSQKYVNALNSTNHTLFVAGLELPSWTRLQAIYGPLDQPVVIGMDTCAHYRATVPFSQRMTASAGMFNTGTNAMKNYLQGNMPGIKGLWQVPWGKHRMPWQRLNHTAPRMELRNQTAVLPVVLVRDPLHWMQSTCKTPYAARWKHAYKHCPSLVPNQRELQRWGAKAFPNNTIPMFVKFEKSLIIHYKSLIDFYNQFYEQYMDATFPRLMVRFEDMLLQPTPVLEQIAECLGTALPKRGVHHSVGSAKPHGSHTTWTGALIKTGDEERRVAQMLPADLEFVRRETSRRILDTFQYILPESLDPKAS